MREYSLNLTQGSTMANVDSEHHMDGVAGLGPDGAGVLPAVDRSRQADTGAGRIGMTLAPRNIQCLIAAGSGLRPWDWWSCFDSTTTFGPFMTMARRHRSTPNWQQHRLRSHETQTRDLLVGFSALQGNPIQRPKAYQVHTQKLYGPFSNGSSHAMGIVCPVRVEMPDFQRLPFTLVNRPAIPPPRTVAATATTTAINATSRPYSTIVGASSSVTNFLTALVNFCISISNHQKNLNST